MRDAVRIQVLLTGEQAREFERLRAIFGSTKSYLGGLMMVLGMRYLMQVVNPVSVMHSDQIERLVELMQKQGVFDRLAERLSDVPKSRKVRAKLVDGRVIEGVYRETTDSSASSYGQKVIEIDNQAIDGWQIVEIEDLD
jgi:hypothetical protein